jgi:hypothetical protein
VTGDFTSTTEANGTWDYNEPNPFPPPSFCTGSGTWTASFTP